MKSHSYVVEYHRYMSTTITPTAEALPPFPLYDALFHVGKPPTEEIGLRRGRWISFAELLDNRADPMSVNPTRIIDIVTPPNLPGYGPPPPKNEWVFWDIEPEYVRGRWYFPRDIRVSSPAAVKEGLDWILYWINGAKEQRADLKHCLYQFGLICDPIVVQRRDGYGSTETERAAWRAKYRRWRAAVDFLMAHELMELLDGHLIECYYRYPGYEADEESVHLHMLEVARQGSIAVRDRIVARKKANGEAITDADRTPKPVIACISMQSPTSADARCTPAQVQSSLRVARAADHAVLWGNFHEPVPGGKPDETRRCRWDAADPLWQLVANRGAVATPIVQQPA